MSLLCIDFVCRARTLICAQHLGFKTKAYTPTYRGFEEWVGYYHW